MLGQLEPHYLSLSNLIAHSMIKQQRSQKLYNSLLKLQEDTSSSRTIHDKIMLDFTSCNMNDSIFAAIVDHLISYFKDKDHTYTIQDLIIDFDGLTDASKEKLIIFITNIIPFSTFCSGTIIVNMQKENYQEIQDALQQQRFSIKDLCIDIQNLGLTKQHEEISKPTTTQSSSPRLRL